MAYNKVVIDGGDTLVDMTDASLSSSDTNKIRAGETAYGNDGEKIEGSIPTSTVMTSGPSTDITALKGSESATVTAGVVDSDVKVTAASLASQTQGDATASDMVSGKTAWVNGSLVTGNITTRSNGTKTTQTKGYGTDSNGVWFYFPSGKWSPDSTGESYTYSKMPNNGTFTKTLGYGEKCFIPEGYHDGNGYMKSPNPSGTVNITSNGTHDVTTYGSASVSVTNPIASLRGLCHSFVICNVNSLRLTNSYTNRGSVSYATRYLDGGVSYRPDVYYYNPESFNITLDILIASDSSIYSSSIIKYSEKLGVVLVPGSNTFTMNKFVISTQNNIYVLLKSSSGTIALNDVGHGFVNYVQV